MKKVEEMLKRRGLGAEERGAALESSSSEALRSSEKRHRKGLKKRANLAEELKKFASLKEESANRTERTN
jgi:hypothetical protein